jgi:hypothetical protein
MAEDGFLTQIKSPDLLSWRACILCQVQLVNAPRRQSKKTRVRDFRPTTDNVALRRREKNTHYGLHSAYWRLAVPNVRYFVGRDSTAVWHSFESDAFFALKH